MPRFLQYVRLPRINPAMVLVGLGVPVAVVAVLKWQFGWTIAFAALGVIAFIVLLVLAWRMFWRWRARRRARSLYDSLETQSQRAAEASAGEERARVAELRQRFDDALGELKRAKKTEYDLPWLLLIGEPQSGKSTTLRGAELHFPVGTERLSGLGGTRNCDWWFTNEAVILDTAGRFTFHQEGAPDRAEWEGFLELLRKKRRHCPINGVLIVIPTDALLNDSAEERREKAANIHSKLTDVQRKLGIQFPVFVILTKCDLVNGFSETFRGFGAVKCAQMIGWSNDGPFDQPYDVDRFDSDFDVIYRRLCFRRLEIVRSATALNERGMIYAFPEEFRALASPLKDYLSIMFAPDIYHDPLFFRGFYFSSGMQEGMPIVTAFRDMLSSGPAGGDVDSEADKLGKLFPSRPFFCSDVYKHKALRETGMVFRSAADIQRGKRLKRLTLVGGSVMAVVMLGLIIFGVIDISRLVEQPRKHATEAGRLVAAGDTLSEKAEPQVARVINLLDHDIDTLERKSRAFTRKIAMSKVDEAVSSLQTIRDTLYLRQSLRPHVIQLEKALTDAGVWKKDDFDDVRHRSTAEYLEWATGVEDPDKAPEDSFDLFFAPVLSELGEPDLLRDQFTRLGRPGERRARVLTSERDDPAATIKGIIGAARQHYEQRYAGPESEKLGPWVTVTENCERARMRFHALLKLAARFDNVRTKQEFDEVFAEWKTNYGLGTSPEAPGFAEALRRVDAVLPQLRSELTAETEQEKAAPWPKLEDVRPAWADAFGSRVTEQSGSFWTRISRSSSPLRESIRRMLLDASDELDAAATRVIEQRIKRYYGKRDALVSGAALQADTEQVRAILKLLDSALAPADPSELGDYLDSWADKFGSDQGLAEIDEARARLEKGATDLERLEGDAGHLSQLTEAVAQAAQRNRIYTRIRDAERRLADQPEMELLRRNATRELDDESTGFASIEERYYGKFLHETLEKLEAVEVGLTALAGRSLTESRPDGDLDPYTRLVDFFEERLRDYVQRYFAAWDGYYSSSTLAESEKLIRADDWETFRRGLTSEELGDAIGKQAERQLDTLEKSVLGLDNELISDAGAAPAARKWRNTHRDMLASAIRTAAGKTNFEDLREGYELWKGSAGEKPLPLGPAARQAFTVFRSSVREVGSEDFGGLETAPLRELSRYFGSDRGTAERVIGKLYYITDWGRFYLDQKLDEDLRSELDNFPAYGNGEFPIEYPGSTSGATVGFDPDQFKRFLQQIAKFESRYGGLRHEDPERTTSRTKFLQRCGAWRDFLYAPNLPAGKARDAKTLANLRANKPELVFFALKYFEPSAGYESAGKYYTKGTLFLGDEAGTLGQAVQGTPAEFRVNRSSDPPGPAGLQRVWKFGERRIVKLSLSGSTGVLPADPSLAEAQFGPTAWALPQFIYSWTTTPAQIQTGQTGEYAERSVWRVPMDVTVGDEALRLIIEVAIKDKVLPPAIGGFDRTTERPGDFEP